MPLFRLLAPRLRNTLLLSLLLSATAVAAVTSVAAAGVPALRPAAHPASDHAPVALAAVAGPRPNTAAAGPRANMAAPSGGFTPHQLHIAYGLPSRGAAHQTIAVVSVYNDPNVEQNLNAYDRQWHLPACTRANGCLRVLNENGKTSPLPEADPSGGQWITESALGVEISHAVCQSCRIVLVEANAADKFDLSNAGATGAGAGATVIVTSATPLEDGSDDEFKAGFTPKHAAVVAAAGDAQGGGPGYGRLYYPAALPNVIAVGGTSLSFNGHGGYRAETAWNQTVSGCSNYHAAPAWQQSILGKVGCGTQRVVADLAAAADPGALVYITGADTPGGPWYVASGTSLAAPIIAGVIGLAGSVGPREPQMLYQHAASEPAAFRDITSGSNSPGCTSPICKAVRGFDGPTGLGTPHGLAAFLANGGAISSRTPRIALINAGGRLRFGRTWRAALSIRNDNPFTVRGRLVLRRRLFVGHRLRTIVFASAPLGLQPLASGRVTFTVARRYRSLLSGRLITLYVQVTERGQAGRTISFFRPVRVSAG